MAMCSDKKVKRGVAKFFRNADAPTWKCVVAIFGGMIVSSVTYFMLITAGLDTIYKNGFPKGSVFWIASGVNLFCNLSAYAGLTCLISKINSRRTSRSFVRVAVAVLSCITLLAVYLPVRVAMSGHAIRSVWECLVFVELCRGLWRWIAGARSGADSEVDKTVKDSTFFRHESVMHPLTIACLFVVVGGLVWCGLYYRNIEKVTETQNPSIGISVDGVSSERAATDGECERVDENRTRGPKTAISCAGGSVWESITRSRADSKTDNMGMHSKRSDDDFVAALRRSVSNYKLDSIFGVPLGRICNQSGKDIQTFNPNRSFMGFRLYQWARTPRSHIIYCVCAMKCYDTKSEALEEAQRAVRIVEDKYGASTFDVGELLSHEGESANFIKKLLRTDVLKNAERAWGNGVC